MKRNVCELTVCGLFQAKRHSRDFEADDKIFRCGAMLITK